MRYCTTYWEATWRFRSECFRGHVTIFQPWWPFAPWAIRQFGMACRQGAQFLPPHGDAWGLLRACGQHYAKQLVKAEGRRCWSDHGFSLASRMHARGSAVTCLPAVGYLPIIPPLCHQYTTSLSPGQHITSISAVSQQHITSISPVHRQYATSTWPVHDQYVASISPVSLCHKDITSKCVCHQYITSTSLAYHQFSISSARHHHITSISPVISPPVYPQYIPRISPVYRQYTTSVSPAHHQYIPSISPEYRQYSTSKIYCITSASQSPVYYISPAYR